MKNVAVLLSGRGSNCMALSDAVQAGRISARLVLVVSNREDAPGLVEARKRGFPTLFIPSRGVDREEFDRKVVAELETAQVDVVCLAGFMRLLTPFFISRFPYRILNIHPSLLPAFPGLHAQRQALEWGVRVSGCTVHFVDEHLDHGPILLQQSVPVLNDDTEETLSSRILKLEHELYPQALEIVCQERFSLENRRIRLL